MVLQLTAAAPLDDSSDNGVQYWSSCVEKEELMLSFKQTILEIGQEAHASALAKAAAIEQRIQAGETVLAEEKAGADELVFKSAKEVELLTSDYEESKAKQKEAKKKLALLQSKENKN